MYTEPPQISSWATKHFSNHRGIRSDALTVAARSGRQADEVEKDQHGSLCDFAFLAW